MPEKNASHKPYKHSNLLLPRHRKEHVPLVDRTEALPPPSLVVVMGPKGCGKSTLIRSLVKYYTRQNLSDVLGAWAWAKEETVGGEMVRWILWSRFNADFFPIPPPLPPSLPPSLPRFPPFRTPPPLSQGRLQ